MTQPRKDIVSVQKTPYYHIVSRCVRRTFLCGFDRATQTSYEHRRQWIVDRIRILSSLFCIEVASYAVMSNHYHLVVKLNPQCASTWNDAEIIARWTSLFKGPLLIQRFQQGNVLTLAEHQTIIDIVAVWRKRLTELSWFMKCLNEPIAKAANKEDQCTGHFWEARYKSQALLTEQALLSCMAYVDLNPVRAGIADTPESSYYTSIRERIQPEFDVNQATIDQKKHHSLIRFDIPVKPLLPFVGTIIHEKQNGILLSSTDYLELVDWTGRAVNNEKRGFILSQLPPILNRLHINKEQWLLNSQTFEQRYLKRCFLGKPQQLRA